MSSNTRPHRVISIAHSYAVALNRRLAHEMARAGGDRWVITAVAPMLVHGDLRSIPFEPYPEPGLEPCGLEMVPLRMAQWVHVMLYGRKLRALLKDSHWDVVHAWEEPYILAGGQIAWWAPRGSAYIFWTAQNLAKLYPAPFSWIERYCLDRCAGWLACGESVAEIQRARGYGRKPHRVMPLGVALDRFHPDAAAGEAVRRRLGWEGVGVPVVGFLGRFVPEKGVSVLTRALDRLEGKLPWRALFVGGGPLEGDLRAWAARHGDRVRVVTGVLHEAVPAYLNAMDVLAAPSQTTPRWREQLGRMLIEAFACGVPVIGSNSGEIPHVVADAGMIIAEHDEAAWTCALADILESPARRASLRQQGLERARLVYAWHLIARRHLEFFAEQLDQRSR
jgi:glycosyltransferase involved in cell wall biosynthesis